MADPLHDELSDDAKQRLAVLFADMKARLEVVPYALLSWIDVERNAERHHRANSSYRFL
jgi:hypothetical protein